MIFEGDSGVKSLAKYGAMSFGVGIFAFALTFASGFGPCGPSTPFDGFLISLGFVTTIRWVAHDRSYPSGRLRSEI
jgi:hypothetical protein